MVAPSRSFAQILRGTLPIPGRRDWLESALVDLEDLDLRLEGRGTRSSTARLELVVVSYCGAVRRCIASGKRRPVAQLAIRFSTFWARVPRSRRPAGSRE